MCDELTEGDNRRHLATRRQFGAGVGAVGLMAVLASPANAATVAGRNVTIKTADGMCDAYFVAPTTGKHPAVLVWPDIFGLRPAFEQMGKRLAESGYAVLVVNQFYRNTKAPFADKGERDAVLKEAFGWRATQTPETTVTDAKAFIDWLDQQKQVDRKRGIATTGYCMGGPMVMRTAAARPDRVRAGASFHGGGPASAGAADEGAVPVRGRRERRPEESAGEGTGPRGLRGGEAACGDRGLCRHQARLVPAR